VTIPHNNREISLECAAKKRVKNNGKKEFRLSFVEIVHYIPTTTEKDFEKRD
jgi:hypothetical protein